MHRLRPGDIDVVGGLGDSLVAGSGALEEFAIGTFIEARGVSWCVGGQGDWRRFLTVPNLLKVLDALISSRSPWNEFNETEIRRTFVPFVIYFHRYSIRIWLDIQRAPANLSRRKQSWISRSPSLLRRTRCNKHGFLFRGSKGIRK